MVLQENWAVDPGRIRAFFEEQEDCVPIPGGFQLSGCTVTLTEEESRLFGKWPMRRSILRFEGEDEAVENIHHRFFTTFLSAGG